MQIRHIVDVRHLKGITLVACRIVSAVAPGRESVLLRMKEGGREKDYARRTQRHPLEEQV